MRRVWHVARRRVVAATGAEGSVIVVNVTLGEAGDTAAVRARPQAPAARRQRAVREHRRTDPRLSRRRRRRGARRGRGGAREHRSTPVPTTCSPARRSCSPRPKNFGYMSGALEGLPRARLPGRASERTQGTPLVALRCAPGNDGAGGGRSSVTRIVTGLRWKAVREPLVLSGDWRDGFTDEVRELGLLMAASLDAGVI